MKIILFLTLMMLFQTLLAKDVFKELDPDADAADFTGDFEDTIWKEEVTKLPELPDEQDLIVFPGVAAYPNYTYAIDDKTLSVGKKDAVVRFIVVISSTSGTVNRYYQGLNCQTKQIKTYAYAHSTAKQFIAYSSPAWSNLNNSGAMGYSKGLADYYFCDLLGGVLKRKAIINNLKYGNNTDGFHYD